MANQAYIRRRCVLDAGEEPLSGRTSSCWWLPGHCLLRNLSHLTLSDSHISQSLFTQTAGPLSCGSATGVTHCLLRAFTGASAVPEINQNSMFDVEMFISKIQAWPVMFNLLKPTGHVMHQQFNIQRLYVLPTLYLCVLYLSENKQRPVPLTA